MRLTDVITLAAHAGARRFIQKRAGVALPIAVGAMLPGIAEKAIERSRSTEQKLEGATGQRLTSDPFKTAALPLQLALPMAQAMSPSGPIGRAGKAVGNTGMNIGDQMLGRGMYSGKPSGLIGSLGALGAAPGEGVAKGISGGLSNLVQKKLFGQDIGERQDALGVAGGAALKSFGAEIGKSSVGLLRDIAMKAMDAVGHAGDESARQAILGDLKRTDSVLAQADDALLMESYHTMQRFAPTLSTDKNAVRSFLRQAVMSGSGPDFMTIKHLADSERAVTGGDKRAALDWSALLRGAAVPAAAGAVAGAVADDDNRLGGALKGGLTGGALGALMRGAQGMRVPRDQGPLAGSPKMPGGWQVPSSMGTMASDAPYDMISHQGHLRRVTPAQGDLAAALRAFSLQGA